MRKEIADGCAALPILLKAPKRLEKLPLGTSDIVLQRGGLTVKFGELGLGIKALHVADPTGHKEKDNVLRLWREMRAGFGLGRCKCGKSEVAEAIGSDL